MKRSLYMIAIVAFLSCLGPAQAVERGKYNISGTIFDINRGKLGEAVIFIQDSPFTFTKNSKAYLKNSRSVGLSRLKKGMRVGIVLEAKTEEHIKNMLPNTNIKEIWILD